MSQDLLTQLAEYGAYCDDRQGSVSADDVIDTELQIITGNPAAGDCVDANDVPFRDKFPYLAPAH